jgi:DNA-directed RNA polymerase subunit RPC12/RpoP
MPKFTDPAPCDGGERLYECQACRSRFCQGGHLAECPNCAGRVENLSKARSE